MFKYIFLTFKIDKETLIFGVISCPHLFTLSVFSYTIISFDVCQTTDNFASQRSIFHGQFSNEWKIILGLVIAVEFISSILNLNINFRFRQTA